MFVFDNLLIFHPSKNCLQKIPNLASHGKKLFCNFKSALVERNNQTIKMSPGTLSWARDRNFFSKFFFYFFQVFVHNFERWQTEATKQLLIQNEMKENLRKRLENVENISITTKYIKNVDNITKTSKTLKTSKYLQNVGPKNHRNQMKILCY